MTEWAIRNRAASYLAACARAVNDDAFFARFKSDPGLKEILEHCGEDQARAYAADLESTGRAENLQWRHLNNRIGGGLPDAPSSYRYAWQLSELMRHFKSLDGMVVAEIGGGYGGLATLGIMVSECFEWRDYDLEWPQRLAVKYVRASAGEIFSPCFVLGGAGSESMPDVLVSCYALSELSREEMSVYADTLLRAPRGFIIFNPGVWNLDEFKGLLRYPVIDYPEPGGYNRVLVWGSNAQ